MTRAATGSLLLGLGLGLGLAGCVAAPPPPPTGSVAATAPPSPADAALARDAALASVPAAAPGVLPPPVLVHAPTADGLVDVATLALPDAVLFDFGAATPRPDAAPVLAALARAIKASPPGTRATVAGNTDAVGSADFNQALSESRARNVAAALAALGVDPGALDAIGFGRRRPVASNDTANGRARNRRVEVALSPSVAANRAALLSLAPARDDVAEAAVAPDPSPRNASDVSPVQPRRPASLAIHPNVPTDVRPNALGPSVSY